MRLAVAPKDAGKALAKGKGGRPVRLQPAEADSADHRSLGAPWVERRTSLRPQRMGRSLSIAESRRRSGQPKRVSGASVTRCLALHDLLWRRRHRSSRHDPRGGRLCPRSSNSSRAGGPPGYGLVRAQVRSTALRVVHSPQCEPPLFAPLRC